jgi:hypothetical protein
MPLYGVAQAGSNPVAGKNIVSLEAGQSYTLLDGTETIASQSKSVAYSKGFFSGFNSPVTFSLSGCKNGTVIQMQQAGADVDGQYTAVATLTPDSSGNQSYTLTDSAPCTRAYVVTFVAGDVPVLIASRL